jgi:hypothetical protein
VLRRALLNARSSAIYRVHPQFIYMIDLSEINAPNAPLCAASHVAERRAAILRKR